VNKMIPKNTSKIILHLLKDMDEFGHNINQVSRKLGISVGSAFKILKSLERSGIVYHREISNASYYRLELDNPETIKVCELLLLGQKRGLKGYARIYADEISAFEDAEMIILFGSILHKTAFNDVDALFLTNQVKKVKKFCLELTKIRTRPVMPLILTKKDLEHAILEKKEAVASLLREGIVLKGESVFLEVMKNVNPTKKA